VGKLGEASQELWNSRVGIGEQSQHAKLQQRIGGPGVLDIMLSRRAVVLPPAISWFWKSV
jgi:hypothetical protein